MERAHKKYFENKIAKNIGLVYREKPFLDKELMLGLYYSFIKSYLNYANLALGSTYLKKYYESEKTTQSTKTRYSDSP